MAEQSMTERYMPVLVALTLAMSMSIGAFIFLLERNKSDFYSTQTESRPSRSDVLLISEQMDRIEKNQITISNALGALSLNINTVVEIVGNQNRNMSRDVATVKEGLEGYRVELQKISDEILKRIEQVDSSRKTQQ